MLINDDCINALKYLSEKSIDLIYMDPPFYTQKIQQQSDNKGHVYSFNDKWESFDKYLEFLKERLIVSKELLKDNGSIFVHCDSTASHYIKILLDDIFGINNFRSEIIWRYKRWSNSKKGLLNAHQNIFYYSKSNKYTFNTIYLDYSPTTNIDQILQERQRDDTGKTVYKTNKDGETLVCKGKLGVPLSDVWDIPYLNPKARERVGYPTQKPIELLERIINISTKKGDVILDPFCGSGTTLVAATILKRECIGFDINKEAIELTKARLKEPFKSESKLLKNGVKSYLTKTDKEMSIIKQFDCDIVYRNKGIDAILRKQYQGLPIALKIKKPNETNEEAVSLLVNAAKKKKCGKYILVTNNNNIKIDELPKELIIIEDYKSQLENILEIKYE